jgi:beta-lactamase regulating signal transducer with metallopeptidase domain
MSLLARFDPGNAVTGPIMAFLVQISLIIMLAAVGGRTVLRRRAVARHGLWLGALILVLICPAAAAVAEHFGVTMRIIALPSAAPAIAAIVADRPTSHVTTLQADSTRSANTSLSGPTGAQVQVPRAGSLLPPDERVHARPEVLGEHQAKSQGSALSGGLTLLWAAIALAGLARIAVGGWRLAKLTRLARPLDPVRHGPALERAKAGLGVGPLPPVLASPAVSGPVALGLLRPCVVLPDGLAEAIPSDALRDVLVHECAHVVRRDVWVGVVQRLVGALLWPHPLVHYMNGQLTRAREEVCDNHVLRLGNAPSYGRTLLVLTEHCVRFGGLQPGLGLLGARWTLRDRVAGLLDPRRVPMTQATLSMKISMAIAVATTGLAVASLRLDRATQAGERNGNQADLKGVRPPEPKNAVWSIDGVVVDEQDKAVPGAVVHAREEADPAGAKSAADGTFTLWFGTGSMYTRELVADMDGGSRIGLVRFDRPRHFAAKGAVRLVIKPARTVVVRVKDAAGAPIPGASVEAFDFAYQFHAQTGPDGVASLRVPADARIPGVIGLKSDAGFDYFENYRTQPPGNAFAFPPLPGEIALTLDGARTVRIKVIDAAGRPVPGVVVKPFRPSKAGKIETIEIAHGATTSVMTDGEGVAVFDWLPKAVAGVRPSGVVTFFVNPPPGFSPAGPLRSIPGGPTELTAQVKRSARLRGVVRYPDGRPAQGTLVLVGLGALGRVPAGTRTDADGKYTFDSIAPGFSRMIVVYDENWAAPSKTSDVLRDGEEKGGLDFTLSKGTLVRGRLTEGPDHRPAAGAIVSLIEEGGPLPKEVRTVGASTLRLGRLTYTDARGDYRLRVGPGRYRLATEGLDDSEFPPVDVQNQDEIVHDLAAKARAREMYLNGVVMEKTATGDRPVAGALAFRWPVYGSSRTDEQGRFIVERMPGETTLYAFCPDKSLAGFASVHAGAESANVIVSKTGRVSGRVVDSNGKPVAKHRVRVQLAKGRYATAPAHFAVSALITDDQGRFTYSDGPVGSTGEFEVFHGKDNQMGVAFERSGPRTVVPFEIVDFEPIEVPEAVVPADRAAK